MWGSLGGRGVVPFDKNKKGTIGTNESQPEPVAEVVPTAPQGTAENPWQVRRTKIWKDKDGVIHRKSY
jgi:hypothetical protein